MNGEAKKGKKLAVPNLQGVGVFEHPLDVPTAVSRWGEEHTLAILRGQIELMLGTFGHEVLLGFAKEVLTHDELVWGHFLRWGQTSLEVKLRPSAQALITQAAWRALHLDLHSGAERRLAVWLVHLHAMGLVSLAWKRRVQVAAATSTRQPLIEAVATALCEARSERSRVLTPALERLHQEHPVLASGMGAALELEKGRWNTSSEQRLREDVLARLITARRLACMGLERAWLHEMGVW